MINIFKKKKDVFVKPTNTQVMDKANMMVENALSMFNQSINAVNEANILLEDVKNDNIQRLKELSDLEAKVKNEIEIADKTIMANFELKQKLSQFVQ